MRPMLVPLLALLGCCACDDSGGSGPGGAGGGGGGGGSGPPLSEVPVTGQVRGLDGQGVADMEICVWDRRDLPCATSTTAGAFSLTVPARTDLLLSFNLEGFLPVLRPASTASSLLLLPPLRHPTRAEHAAWLAAAGLTQAVNKGVLLFEARDGAGEPLAGVVVGIAPESGDGPAYAGTDDLPDPALQATGAAGYGLFTNVDPGRVPVSLSHPDLACERVAGSTFAGASPGEMPVQVVAGYASFGASVSCR